MLVEDECYEDDEIVWRRHDDLSLYQLQHDMVEVRGRGAATGLRASLSLLSTATAQIICGYGVGLPRSCLLPPAFALSCGSLYLCFGLWLVAYGLWLVAACGALRLWLVIVAELLDLWI